MDRLEPLLERFTLRANVFNTGPLCRLYEYQKESGLGYLHLLQQGSFQLELVGSGVRTVTAPSLVLLMQAQDHRIVPLPGDAVVSICGEIDFGQALDNPIMHVLPPVIVIDLNKHHGLQPLIDLLKREAFNQQCGRQAVLNRLCELLVIELLRESMDRLPAQSGLLSALANPQLAKAINKIHQQPGFPWSLESLAELANMSRASFAQKFKSAMGVTPGDYLVQWRLAIAKKLLRSGNPVSLVAERVGYSSGAVLSRAFHKQFGLSPREWLNLKSSEV